MINESALADRLGHRPTRILRALADHERALWITLIVGVLADIVLTYVGVSYLGAVERNPLALSMFAEVGIIATGVILKGWLLVAFGFARTFVPRLLFGYALAVASALHAVICINNAIVILVLASQAM